MSDLPEEEKSLWREAYSHRIYTSLLEDIKVDTVVIGGGITGLTTAYLLKQRGQKVAVLDKDTIGGGTTGRTTGKVTSQHGIMYESLVRQIGVSDARLYAEANQAALDMVDKIIKREQLVCDWQRDDNYVFTSDATRITEFKREARIAERLGLPASFAEDTGLPFAVAGAVRFLNQGKFNAEKYALGLAAKVNGGGSYVFEYSNVIGVRDGIPARVKTAKGSVLADDIVVATNVPTLPLIARGGYCILEYPTESYIVAGPYDKPIEGMYISPDKEHHSILPIKVGKRSHILVGGGGHLSGLGGNRNKHFDELARYGRNQLGMSNISHRWSDRDYSAYDKIPLIGKLYPWSKHVYVGTAYKKWGLTGGTVAGMILTDLITKNQNPWAHVFSPQRTGPIRKIPQAIKEQLKELTGK